MSYFVTGATGFIGRHLVERLLDREGDIFVLVREGSEDKLERLRARGGRPADRIKPVKGDISEPSLGLSDEDKAALAGRRALLPPRGDLRHDRLDEERNRRLNVARHPERRRPRQRARREALPLRLLDRGRGRVRRPSSPRTTSTSARRSRTRTTRPSSRPRSSSASRPRCRGASTARRSSSATRATGEMDKIDGPYYFFKAIQKVRHTLPEWFPLVGLEVGQTNIVPGRLRRRRDGPHRPPGRRSTARPSTSSTRRCRRSATS